MTSPVLSEIRFVLVHLGKNLPAVTLHNLRYLKKNFPHVQLVLIISKDNYGNYDIPEDVQIVRYSRKTELNSILELNVQGRETENNFWSLTIERLFAALDYQRDENHIRMLHIESDVLIFPNFPILELTELNKIAWCKYNQTHDVASLFFIPSAEKAKWLVERLQFLLSQTRGWTDMTSLSKISESYPEHIDFFPSASRVIPEMINQRSNLANNELRQISKLEMQLNGIVDPAAIGMYLTGRNPYVNQGWTSYFDPSEVLNGNSYIDPTVLKYEFHPNGCDLIRNGKKVSLFSIHVHSKNIEFFKPGNFDQLNVLANRAREQELMRKFDLTILIEIMKGLRSLRDWAKFFVSFNLTYKAYLKFKKYFNRG